MKSIKIVKFPFCNYFSLVRYLKVRSFEHSLISASESLSNDSIIILPGVGSFASAMQYLRESNLLDLITDHVQGGGIIMGICLGMQVLFDFSDESPQEKGLGFVKGCCKQIPKSSSFSVPHMGWNSLVFPNSSHLYNGSQSYNVNFCHSELDYYFVHSYYARPENSLIISAFFEHPSGLLCASIIDNNIIGFQFHPEKSGKAGYKLLDNAFEYLEHL